MNFIPYDRSLTQLARDNRKNPTPAEVRFYIEVLKCPPFDKYKFIRQKPLFNYIVDFYCSHLKLAIEMDGDSHAEQETYDRNRSRVLSSYGIRVVRYDNFDVINNIEGVYADFMKVVFGQDE